MPPKFFRARSSMADDDVQSSRKSGDLEDGGAASVSSGTVTGLAFCLRVTELVIVDPIVHRLMRWSISPFGLLVCYRLPMLLSIPLDLLTLYCPFSDVCGFSGSLVDYPIAGAVSALALVGTYLFVWRESGRYWKPHVVSWLMRFLLVPVAKGINACLETRQLPNSTRVIDLTRNVTLLNIASVLYLVLSLPFIILTDVFVFLRWPAAAVGWNFISDYERARSISFALFSAPIQLVCQIFLVLTVTGGFVVPAALGVTSVFLVFNVVNAKHQADTIGNFAGFFANIGRLVSMKTMDKNEPPFARVLRSRKHMDYSSAGAFTVEQAGGLARFMLTNKTLEALILVESNKISAECALAIGRAIQVEQQNNGNGSMFKSFNDMDVKTITTDPAVSLTPDVVRVPLFVLGDAALKIKLKEVSCLEGIPWLSKPRTDAKRLELFDASGLIVLTLLQFNSTLIDLDLGSNRLTDACAPSIREVLTSCEALNNLDLSLNPLLTAKGVKVFAEDLVTHRSLKTVRMSTIHVDIGEVKIARNVDFSVSTVYKDAVKRVLDRIVALAKEHKLSAKELGYPPVEDFRGILQRLVSRNYRVARDFFRSLPEQTQALVLERALVRLGHPYATDPGEKLDLKAELNEVRNNPQRPVLLYAGQLSTSVVTPAVAVVLATALANGPVENLDLRGAMIGEEGLDALFSSLASCKAVLNVDLAYNDLSQVTNRSVDLYAEMVGKTESLKLLNLTGNVGFTNHTERLQRLAGTHPKLKLKLR